MPECREETQTVAVVSLLKKHMGMPRSRFIYDMKALRNIVRPLVQDVVRGRNVVLLACKMLAKRMSPFRVPTDTVMFSRVTTATKATPITMKMPIDKRYIFKHLSLHSEDPSIMLRHLAQLPQRTPKRW